jgi:ABC-2 type transport system ATP-binding protein
VRGLNKQFGAASGAIQALDDVSFRVEPGEIFGFVGANGAGKTTTMRVIMGVLMPDSGEVLLGDRPATAIMRCQIGYMPSERGLYPKMKVLDQLMFFGQLRGLSKAEAKVQAADLLKAFDVEQYASKQLQTLSTGNQQRIQLAVTLIGNPRALILDEPFSGLDPSAVDVMIGVLRNWASRGVPIVFSSHQLELVDKLSDKVGIIKKGQIVAYGTQDELRAKVGAEPTITIPTPLANIFGNLISVEKGEEN